MMFDDPKKQSASCPGDMDGDGNPDHLEDFDEVLRRAAQADQADDQTS